jgi:hypothetical protein
LETTEIREKSFIDFKKFNEIFRLSAFHLLHTNKSIKTGANNKKNKDNLKKISKIPNRNIARHDREIMKTFDYQKTSGIELLFDYKLYFLLT